VLERVCTKDMATWGAPWIHTKCLYRLSDDTRKLLKGVSETMCSTSATPSGISPYPRRSATGIPITEAIREAPP
jgi:hypothetical protein